MPKHFVSSPFGKQESCIMESSEISLVLSVREDWDSMQYTMYLVFTSKVNILNFILASGDFCRLLITFANSLDPDQDKQSVGPDLDPKRLTLLWCS